MEPGKTRFATRNFKLDRSKSSPQNGAVRRCSEMEKEQETNWQSIGELARRLVEKAGGK